MIALLKPHSPSEGSEREQNQTGDFTAAAWDITSKTKEFRPATKC